MMSSFETYMQDKDSAAVYTLASNAKLVAEDRVAVYHLAEPDNDDPSAQSEVRYLVVFVGATYASMIESDAEYSTTAALFVTFHEEASPIVAKMGELDPATFTVKRKPKMDRLT